MKFAESVFQKRKLTVLEEKTFGELCQVGKKEVETFKTNFDKMNTENQNETTPNKQCSFALSEFQIGKKIYRKQKKKMIFLKIKMKIM